MENKIKENLKKIGYMKIIKLHEINIGNVIVNKYPIIL